MHERKSSLDHAVMARRNGVSDGFRTSPRCCNVVIQHDTVEHTMQRRTVTSQCLKRFVRSNSIARLGVPLCTVSRLFHLKRSPRRSLPLARKVFSLYVWQKSSPGMFGRHGVCFGTPTPSHSHAIEPHIETSESDTRLCPCTSRTLPP